QGTPEENKDIVQGSISHFGTYAVNEGDKTITFHIQTSTFPNWDGMAQRRPFTLSGDELKYTVPTASGGGTAEVVLKRLKQGELELITDRRRDSCIDDMRRRPRVLRSSSRKCVLVRSKTHAYDHKGRARCGWVSWSCWDGDRRRFDRRRDQGDHFRQDRLFRM